MIDSLCGINRPQLSLPGQGTHRSIDWTSFPELEGGQLTLKEGAFLNPHLLERRDRRYTAIDFLGFGGAVFRDLLKQRGCACGHAAHLPELALLIRYCSVLQLSAQVFYLLFSTVALGDQ